MNQEQIANLEESDNLPDISEPGFLALEERIMFDGAMGAEALDAAADRVLDETPEPQTTPYYATFKFLPPSRHDHYNFG